MLGLFVSKSVADSALVICVVKVAADKGAGFEIIVSGRTGSACAADCPDGFGCPSFADGLYQIKTPQQIVHMRTIIPTMAPTIVHQSTTDHDLAVLVLPSFTSAPAGCPLIKSEINFSHSCILVT